MKSAASMRYRSFPGGAFTRWRPGWSLRLGRLTLNWHVLNVWRWGHDSRLAHVQRGCLHLGKRLLTWGHR